MRHKNKAQSLLKRFFSYVLTQFESPIKVFQNDNDGEFISLCSFFQETGVFFSTFLHLHASTKYGTQASSHLTSNSSFKNSSSTPSPLLEGVCVLTAIHIINRLLLQCSLSKLFLNFSTQNHLVFLIFVSLVV